MSETHTSANVAETLAIAAAFADTLGPGDVVSLAGELGAGKTVFARGVCDALGVAGEVTSPTFTLIHEHPGDRLAVYHMDFYRLERPAEILGIGVEDYFYGDGVCLVEWAENMGGLFPADAIVVRIDRDGNGLRTITIERQEER